MASRIRRPTTDAVEILRRRYVDGRREAGRMLEQARAEADLARTLYRLRSGAGLTQEELARRIGTTASVISRLEDADYNSHSLTMLRRIAAALGRRVEIRFPSARGRPSVKQGDASGNATGQPGPSRTTNAKRNVATAVPRKASRG
jgi:transcriptional regulator with XRE-family HTH domain